MATATRSRSTSPASPATSINPVAHDDTHGAWYFGTPVEQLRAPLLQLEAPDFELPDLSGRRHRLTEQRGKKVLLIAWASW